MYADDTSLSMHTKSLADLTEGLNVLKTNCLLVAYYQNHKSLTGLLGLKINENELEVANGTKYLGFQVDQNLNWKKHINETSKKSRGL